MKPVTFFFLTGVVEYLDIEIIIAIFVITLSWVPTFILAVLFGRHHGSLVQWTEQEISNLPTKVRLLHGSHSSDLSIPIWYGTDR